MHRKKSGSDKVQAKQRSTRTNTLEGGQANSEKKSERGENPVHEDTMASSKPSKGAKDKSDIEVSNSDLQSILVSIEAKMTDGFSDVNDKLTDISEKIEKLESDVELVKIDQEQDHEEIEILKKEVSELRTSLLHTKVYSRKYHLLIYGVTGPEDTNTATIQIVREFAKSSLQMNEEYANRLMIRNAHRLQRRDDGSPSPIIIVFGFWSERESFLRAGKHLRGSKMRIKTDLPPELKKKRYDLGQLAYQMHQDKEIQTWVREKGIDVWIETRRDDRESWRKV
jgi:hypothetical protein